MGIYIKKYCLNFQSVFLLFLFSIYKMVDIMENYKSLHVSIGAEMTHPEMLKFVPDHLKTKKMLKNYVIY